MNELEFKEQYLEFYKNVKERIIASKIKAVRSANKELIQLYWNIGKEIIEKQEKLGWGKSVVEELSKDLRRELGNIEGYSERNLWNMRLFYNEYKEDTILQQLVAELLRGNNLLLMSKIKDKRVTK